MTKEKALGYIRVSTIDQAEYGWGLKVQKEQIQDYCLKNKLELERIYEDDGYSGSDANRPDLQELLKRVKEGGIKKVIVPHSSRVARDSLLSEIIYRDLRKNGIELLSTTQPEYYEQEGDFQKKLIRTVLDAFDEYEKSLIAYRLKNGKRKKAQNGGFHGGTIYGYKSKNKKLVIDKQEAEMVKKIFYWKRQKRLSYSQIAIRLNLLGIKTKHGKKWFPYTIEKIIKNPIYRGKIRFLGKEYLGTHPKII
jgi:DNA invertase Pin-like site-specific DNA recombinase